MKGVSIIIPAYNESANIEKCLESIERLDYPLFEVIVADGGSSDGTKEIISKKFPKIKVIDNIEKFTSSGRNKAIIDCLYEYIAFTDADCRVPEDWLKILVKSIDSSEKDVAGVGGANFAPPESPIFVRAISSAQKTFIGNLGSVQGKVFEKQEEVESIATCNALYKKKALFEVGLFAHKDLGEDWELNHKLRLKGYRLLVVPCSFVWHNFRSSPKKFFSNMFRYGMARAILMKKYPNSIKPIHLFPILFLATMFFIPFWIPYAFVLFLISIMIDKPKWKYVWMVFVLQHFGYALGEVFGLLFDDRIRL